MDEVDGDEFIIRRIPPGRPGQDTVLPPAGERATSATLMLREGEEGLSCSRLSITSPEKLLAQIDKSTKEGWSVCVWKVSELPEDLCVVVIPSDPPELDLGHCEIRPKPGIVFSRKLASKLAKVSKILLRGDVLQ
jgi:hypothetical protein